MGPSFDPYYNWLGIPAAEQPPHYYRLLGLAPLESNPTVIEHAADRVMIHLRTFAAGPHGPDSQRLLNEVAMARVSLLDAARKARYDADLQARLGLTGAGPAPANRGSRLPQAAALPPMPVQVPVPLQPTGQPMASLAAVVPVAIKTAPALRKSRPGRKPAGEVANPEAAAIINTVKIVMGALGGLSMAILLVWMVFGIDALGLFGKGEKSTVVQNPAPDPGPLPKPQRVDPTPPVTKNSTPRPVSPTPGTPTPAEPVIDPTEPTDPAPPVVSPNSPSVKKSKKKKAPPPTTPPATSPATYPTSPPETPPVVAPTPPPTTPAGTAADKRHPVPSQDDQNAKFEEFKSFYPKEFADAERAPAREKFPDFLIAKADAIKSDPVARFAILRQAYTRLIAAKDFNTAVEIVDRLEQEYQVDELAMRVHTLTKASAVGRQTPAEKQSLALCASELAELALRRQRIEDAALPLARMAENLSKALQNKAFRERTITLKEEVEKAQAEWGPVERARQTLAATPDDAAAALVDGRYRCLVAGDWATGLPVLAKGGADPLAAAARLDMAGANDPKAAAAIGDAWYDLAKSDDKLKPLYARALHWYRQAVANATGADQVPWLQRVELIEGLNLPERYFAAVHDAGTREPLPPFVSMFFRNVEFNATNCLARVDPLILKASPWSAYSSTTIYTKPGRTYAKLPTNVGNLPREYQVGVRVGEYYSGQDGPFALGMVGPRGPFTVVIDEPLGTEFGTYITLAGKTRDQNPTLVRSARKRLEYGEEPVLVQVRRNSVTVQIDNQTVTQYDGDLDQLASPAEWLIPKYGGLLVGAHIASYRVTSWVLEPVAPAPRLGKTPEPPAIPGLPNFP